MICLIRRCYVDNTRPNRNIRPNRPICLNRPIRPTRPIDNRPNLPNCPGSNHDKLRCGCCNGLIQNRENGEYQDTARAEGLENHNIQYE